MTFDGRAPGRPPGDWDARLAALPPLAVPSGRTVVVAAHPDDETLGAGGLLAALAAAGRPADVVVATDGAASHPGSPTLAPEALAALRADEVRAAVALLSPRSAVHLLGLPDGGLREHRDAFARALLAALAEGDPDGPGPAAPLRLVAPWRGDGHRDHRVAGEVVAEVAETLGAELWEYPLWFWHWGDPAQAPALAGLPLTPRWALAKRRAVDAHATQVLPLSAHPADTPALHPRFLRAFDRDAEPFVVTPAPGAGPATRGEQGPAAAERPGYFDALYGRHEDPWGFVHRPYEARKRALTLAALPDARVGAALELGCSIGVLTEALAPRCDRLLAVDVAEVAVRRARARTAGLPGVRVERADVRDGVPAGPWDLVLLSEVGYYLDAAALTALVDRLAAATTPGGTLLTCHWRHPVADYPLPGDTVHHLLADTLAARDEGWTRLSTHVEEDFLLDVWSTDARSVARRTGLR